MSAQFQIKGRCPGALSPMASGDGLVVRIRPRSGVISSGQVRTISSSSTLFGNGFVELTSRANLQIRGVAIDAHAEMIAMLKRAFLIDLDVEREDRRNIVVTPFGRGELRREAMSIAHTLDEHLARVTGLPAKFGFAIDNGTTRVLAHTPADIRIERDAEGHLIVRADGMETGQRIASSKAISPEAAALAAVRLAEWFVASGGVVAGRGRMAWHLKNGARPPGITPHRGSPAPLATPARPGAVAEGFLVASEFGQLPAEGLLALADICDEMRITPWRMLMLADVDMPPLVATLISSPDDARLRVSACTGAPGCPQAHAQTRPLAHALATHVPAGQHLHVSGCQKGCAMTSPASFTLVAHAAGFSLVRDGTARSLPVRPDLSMDDLMANPSLVFGEA